MKIVKKTYTNDVFELEIDGKKIVPIVNEFVEIEGVRFRWVVILMKNNMKEAISRCMMLPCKVFQ